MKMKHWQRWVLVAILSFFVLAGQTVATILGRFYYDEGGNSKWMATLVQSAGSPLLLLPLLFLPSSSSATTSVQHSLKNKVAIYIFFGIVIACDNLMYSYGLLFLPVSTYSLICATQLAFNAVFSYYINSEKLTAFVLNSVILLTFSAALLGLNASSESSNHVIGEKYALGFILTVAASAIFSLLLSLLQLTYDKYFKTMSFRVVFELQTCTGFIAACASVAGLFASGEWRSLPQEMEEFKKGTEAYVMTLVWIAISWQMVSVGIAGLVFMASSLLANMIGTLGLPLVPIFAVIFLNDRMDGVKVMALLIALWGFLSYIYQQYLDDSEAKKLATTDSMEISVVSSSSLREPLEGTGLLPQSTHTMARNLQWWFKVSVHTVLVLAGQLIATLLGRFYYDQGGKSKWLQTLTFSAGFPILYLPLLITTHSTSSSTFHPLPLVKITVIYIIIGLIATGDSLMYSYGLLYLSVSTYSLVSATQLGFNAVFSYFINSERFTHLTFNSVIILTFSAAIIAFQPDSDDSSETSGGKYMLGFILTLAASAAYSLNLSLMELTFDKIIKCRALAAVLNMQIYTALVSTVGATIGLFASGEWRELKRDMEGFNRGRLSYVMTLVWTSICWQVTNVGLVGLIFEVSSLFSNVISSLAVPIAPVFAVILFHDKINGIKVMSLLMALWGFTSYFYQHYLDYKREKKAMMEAREAMQLNAGV